MIAEIAMAAFLFELARGAYYTYKELNRSKRSAERFSELMWSSDTWDELFKKVEADKVNNPELYKKVPQTWMPRLYDKFTGE